MLIRDDIVRRLENDRLAAVMIVAAGGEITVPDVEDELARFEQALAEPPQVMSRADVAKAELRRALGLSAIPERTPA